jgi:hypothetical protein
VPDRWIFDAPVQNLRAGDRILKSPEPFLHLETVVFVRSSRNPNGAPLPYAPVAVITTANADKPMEEVLPSGPTSGGAPVLPWGTRVTIERVPEPSDVFHVSALEPVWPGKRLTVQVLSELEIQPGDHPNPFGWPEGAAAGAIVSELLDQGQDAVIDAAPREGEAIGVWWYVDGHRIETPAEHSARDAADLFADHTVRLRPAGADAGETCASCGRVISWLDHLPPSKRGEPVRCHAARKVS